MNRNGQKNFQTKRKVTFLYFLIDEQQEKDNPFHLQIKVLKLDHSSNYKPFTLRWKYSKGLCTGQLKLTYTHNIRIILFKSPLNNTNPWVTFFQNQQPVTTHSMNPLMLPFLPKFNHQTRFLMQENPNMSSPQGTHCIATRGDSQNCFQCLTCCETSHVIYIFFLLINRIP